MPERVIPCPNLDVLARECERVGLGLSDPCVAPCMTVFSPVIRRGFSSRWGAFEEPPRMSSERDTCLRKADEAKRRATQLPPKKIAKTPSKKLTALPPGDVAADAQRGKESPGRAGASKLGRYLRIKVP